MNKKVNIVKNRKQRLLRLKFNIRYGVQLAVLGLFYLCGASIATMIGVYAGYRALRLITQLLRLVLATVYTVISILILLLIIYLIII